MKQVLPILVFIAFAFQACNKSSSDPTPTSVDTSAIVRLPTVQTDSAGAVKSTTAKIYGRVLSEGNSALIGAGVAWGTSPNPTTFDNVVATTGFGVGSYSVTITGLTKLRTYYARTYATNSKGTHYGQQVQFTTRELTLAEKLAKSWVLTDQTKAEYHYLYGTTYSNTFLDVIPCERDNVMSFLPNSVYQVEKGALACNINETDILETGTWSVGSADSTYTITRTTYGSTYTTRQRIDRISENELRITKSTSNSYITYINTYQPR
jgi:hypothetical protein